MKAHLRLMGEIRPEKKLSVVSFEQSVLYHWLRAQSWLIPKTYNIIPVLFFVFVSCGAALAQESVVQTTPAAKAETEITPLKIGDKIPDELWDLPLQVVNHPESKEIITLNDYRDKELIILDFWATWCGSCIESLKKLEKLRRDLGDAVAFIPITSESKQDIRDSRASKHHKTIADAMSIVSDKVFSIAFPKYSLPHVVWLSPDGVIKKTSVSTFVKPEIIREVITTGSFASIASKEEYFDKETALLKLGSKSAFNYPFVDTVIEGAIRDYGIKELNGKDGQVRYYINHPVFHLYFIALGLPIYFYNSQVVVNESSFASHYIPYQKEERYKWEIDHLYCFIDSTRGKDSDPSELKRMKLALDEYFGLHSFKKFETRQCIVVKGMDNKDDLGKVISIRQSIRRLNNNMNNLIIIDETLENHRFPIMELPMNAPDIESLAAALRDMGWVLDVELREVEMVHLLRKEMEV